MSNQRPTPLNHLPAEIPLTGGRSTAGVVRIGETVRRPLGTNGAYTQALLKLLEEKGFGFAPRFLGVDDQNRSMLTFLEGAVPFQKTAWTEAELIPVALLLRQFHDATARSPLAADQEVACHNDFAPWNIILREDKLVGIIDFDEAAPGSRAADFSYFLWTFLGLGPDTAVVAQAQRMAVLCQAYGFQDGTRLVRALLSQQERIWRMRQKLARHAPSPEERLFSLERARTIQVEMEWVKENQRMLRSTC